MLTTACGASGHEELHKTQIIKSLNSRRFIVLWPERHPAEINTRKDDVELGQRCFKKHRDRPEVEVGPSLSAAAEEYFLRVMLQKCCQLLKWRGHQRANNKVHLNVRRGRFSVWVPRYVILKDIYRNGCLEPWAVNSSGDIWCLIALFYYNRHMHGTYWATPMCSAWGDCGVTIMPDWAAAVKSRSVHYCLHLLH